MVAEEKPNAPIFFLECNSTVGSTKKTPLEAFLQHVSPLLALSVLEGCGDAVNTRPRGERGEQPVGWLA